MAGLESRRVYCSVSEGFASLPRGLAQLSDILADPFELSKLFGTPEITTATTTTTKTASTKQQQQQAVTVAICLFSLIFCYTTSVSTSASAIFLYFILFYFLIIYLINFFFYNELYCTQISYKILLTKHCK